MKKKQNKKKTTKKKTTRNNENKLRGKENKSGEAVLTSTHNLCFWAEKKKNNVYPCKPQFYYIIVGFKGVKII